MSVLLYLRYLSKYRRKGRIKIKLIRKEGDTDETHVISGRRVVLSTVFFIALGLGFMYQQAADTFLTKLLSIRQRPKHIIPAKESDKTTEIVKAISAYQPSLDEEDVSSYARIVREESEKYGYDWELILAIIRTESSLDVRARSRKGARGLMQLMPSTARWLSPKLGLEYGGKDSLYDPEYNIRLGTHYLHMLHQKYGDIEKALAAYNRGPSGLARYLREGKKLPSRYSEKVMDHYRQLKNDCKECTG